MKTDITRENIQNASLMKDLGARQSQPFWKNFAGALIFSVTMIILARWFSDLPAWRDVIVSENGPVERMSAALWFMATIWCLAAGWRYSPYRVEWLGLTTMCLLFGLRELDAHIWATGWNLDKLANYWNFSIPIWERLLVVGCMFIPISWVGAILCYRIWLRLGVAGRSDASWIGQMTVGGILLSFCLVLDKVGDNYLPLLGLEGAQLLVSGMEELSEYVLSIYSVAALWPYWQAALSPHDTEF
jgi:hypothetical protein